MKVLVIMGSPRKGNNLSGGAEDRRDDAVPQAFVEFEYLMLRDVNLEPCRECMACLGRRALPRS